VGRLQRQKRTFKIRFLTSSFSITFSNSASLVQKWISDHVETENSRKAEQKPKVNRMTATGDGKRTILIQRAGYIQIININFFKGL
jgi:hypothetical protein